MRTISLSILAIALLIGCESKAPAIRTETLSSGTTALLQAISILDDQTAWVSGHNATFLRTIDGGASWQDFKYEIADTLQFRDLHALSADEVILMSAGSGHLSRIFKYHIDSGFTQQYVMPHAEGFLNSIAFWDEKRGLAFGDSFGGELFILSTDNGGMEWKRVDSATLPPAGQGEGGFAASGTCITVLDGGLAWIATGAGGNARVSSTKDFGNTWEVAETPIIKGTAAGITSIRMLDAQFGSIVGGDLAITDAYTDNVAFTKDGGTTWTLASQPITKGAFYGSDLIVVDGKAWLFACGPNGIDYTIDQGKSFIQLDTGNYWAIEMHESGWGLATGTDGKIMKVSFD
ncbi:MAG: photosystem II stability/assembly factor-like uncharacterized protein [Marinoscillum sp.]|jgi:photosystem II stability/assembly factor-like uncharacterized protein